MGAARYSAKAVVADGKIYVTEGLKWKDRAKAHWAEVFDPFVGQWEAVPSPIDGVNPIYPSFRSYAMNNRFCIRMDGQDFRFDPKIKTWEVFENELGIDNRRFDHVGDGVMYCWGDFNQKFEVHDRKNGVWKELQGFWPKGQRILRPMMVNVGGERFLTVWGQIGNGTEEEKESQKWGIWCAEIELKKKKIGNDEEWSAQVLSPPEKIKSLSGSSFSSEEEAKISDFFYFCASSVCISVSL